MPKVDLLKLSRNYTNYKWSFGEKAPKEDLIYLYVECRCSISEIVKIIGGSKSGVSRWIKEYGINKPAPIINSPELTDEIINKINWSKVSRNFLEQPWKRNDIPIKEDFEYLYIELNLSVGDIAQIIGRSKNRVQKILASLDIHKPIELCQQSREKVNLRKYGTKHTIAMAETREKIEETTIRNYGVKSVLCDKSVREGGMTKKYGKAYPQQVHLIREKTKETIKEHYGKDYYFQTDEFKERVKQQIMDKYGVDNIAKVPETINKIKSSIKEHYGEQYTFAAQVPEIQEKIVKTNMKRYGTERPTQNDSIKEKIEKTNIKNYGVKTIFLKDGFREYTNNVMMERYGTTNTNVIHVRHRENMTREFWLNNFIDPRGGGFDTIKCATYHGISNSCVQVYLDKFNITMRHKSGSVHEADIINYIKSLGVKNIKKSNRAVIKPRELDIFLPDYNIAIEYDGLMYHSQGRYTQGKIQNISLNYHLSKMQQCKKLGIQLFHIFENEWLNNPEQQDIWKSMICSKLGHSDRIYARKLRVTCVDSATAMLFCEVNHLQGPVKSTYNYALVDDNEEIYALMTFGKPRFNKRYNWELLRYCCKKYTNVVGGASRLLSHFRKDHEGSIISYANLRWSNGNLYEKLGFKLVNQTAPNYFYFKTKDGKHPVDMKLYSRMEFQKHKLKDKLETFDEKLTEKENMYMNNYRTIYDCGNLAYVLS